VSFDSVTQLHLQPSALAGDPDLERAMFLRDIAQEHRLGTGMRERSGIQDRANFHRNLRARSLEAARGFRNLTPKEKKYKPPGNPNQYMVDAIMRDNAVAQYERDAPRLRGEQRASLS